MFVHDKLRGFFNFNPLTSFLINDFLNYILTFSLYSILSCILIYMLEYFYKLSFLKLVFISLIFLAVTTFITIVKENSKYNFTIQTFTIPNEITNDIKISFKFSTLLIIIYYLVFGCIFFYLKTKYDLTYLTNEKYINNINMFVNNSMIMYYNRS